MNDTLNFPSLPLFIEHKIDGDIIAQRPTDGYINATSLCKKAGKLFNDYSRLKSTGEYLDALSVATKIPRESLVQSIMGGSNVKEQGTWVHPKVAIHLAQWLSPEFSVQVSDWVFDWISGNVSGYMPDHVKRYMANRAKIPHTHFSMLNEVYLNLYAPMEAAGYNFTKKMMPDISTGRIFSDFLRERGLNPDGFDTYDHVFTDGRIPVKARLYPIDLLPDFRKHFNEVWLPKKAVVYFRKADPKALPYLKLALPLATGTSPKKLR